MALKMAIPNRLDNY